VPSYPPISESNPNPSHDSDSAATSFFIDYAPSLAILCAWGIQIWALGALVREVVPLPRVGWERDDELAAGGTGGRRGDLFFHPPGRSEEQEGLLAASGSGRRSAPTSPTTPKSTKLGGAGWGSGRGAGAGAIAEERKRAE